MMCMWCFVWFPSKWVISVVKIRQKRCWLNLKRETCVLPLAGRVVIRVQYFKRKYTSESTRIIRQKGKMFGNGQLIYIFTALVAINTCPRCETKPHSIRRYTAGIRGRNFLNICQQIKLKRQPVNRNWELRSLARSSTGEGLDNGFIIYHRDGAA